MLACPFDGFLPKNTISLGLETHRPLFLQFQHYVWNFDVFLARVFCCHFENDVLLV